MTEKAETKFEPKIQMLDAGTRYQHLSDLFDLWSSGLEIARNAYHASPTSKDKVRVVKLEAAVAMLGAHMDHLADYEKKKRGLQDEVDAIPKNKKEGIDEIKEINITASLSTSDLSDQDASPDLA